MGSWAFYSILYMRLENQLDKNFYLYHINSKGLYRKVNI